MVIFSEWHRTAMDLKSRSGLPVTGEDTGLGAVASPLAGYLGKVQERACSLEYCPWCTSKGLTCALRSYRINLQDSITLCTNPQCLFPLVSRSLEDVLASLNPVEPTVGNKRKNASVLEKEELIKPERKRLRSSEPDSLGPQSVTNTHSQAEWGVVNVVSNGHHAAPKTDGEKVNSYHRDSSVAETTGWDVAHNEDDTLDKEPDVSARPLCSVSAGHLQCSSDALLTCDGDDPAQSPHSGALGASELKDDFRQVKAPPEVLNRRREENYAPKIGSLFQHNEQTTRTEQISLAADINTHEDVKLEAEDLLKSEELVPVPNQLFWRNSNNLCWLDSLLVALVNCKSLRKCKPKDEPQRSSVWRLMTGYEDICAAIQAHQQPGTDGIVRVPNHVLQKANADLWSLRMTIFKLLQPKLHCKLGQRETPVFAVPLLLTMDSWVEPLFQLTFHWEFKCSECKTATKERVIKTLPTFTNISLDWGPLHAVHSAPCNVCYKRNQKRTMMLERVPPVFQLHFVEGLPDNDVRIYTFTFKGKRYSVTTVIQYNQQLKHFVTWICNSDGSWREYDDLKHPKCKTHEKLPVPAEEIHIVFWEVEEDKEPPACSPSSTFAESPPSKKEMNPSQIDKDLTGDEELSAAHSLNNCPLMSHDDTDIICALSPPEDGGNIMDATVTAGVDTSIGSTTLLDTFEGLTHNDIITLTLVELKVDSEMQPVSDDGKTEDLRNDVVESTPDSSSAVIDGEMSPSHHDELPTTSSPSESDDSSSSDPTFVPGARGGRGRGRGAARSNTVSRQTGKKAASSKAAPPPASESEPSKVIHNESASAAAAAAAAAPPPPPPPPAPPQDNTAPVETTQQVSPVSLTDTSPLCTAHKSSAIPPTLHPNTRWSYLLSKNPLHQAQKPIDKPAPTMVRHVKPAPVTHSTPNPVRRPQIPVGRFPKPQLMTEESDGLPLKAAEMYGAFGANSSSIPPKVFQPITSNQKSLMNTTVVCATSLPEKSSKKHQSSKVPEGLSHTEALRYKLLKKLKAKKKRLAKLNEKLGQQGGSSSLRPDSTDLCSPNTVTSSTYDGSICDDILSDLLSPATTASNLSPDSTGFLEMLANGQDSVDTVSQVKPCVNEPNTETFLDDFDFLSQAVAKRQSEIETEALSALEFFV
ncbi:SUMO-specific isopeptidase USPL1 [Symphorus nematophorus]